MSDNRARPLVHVEDLDAAIDRAIEASKEFGESLRLKGTSRVSTVSPLKPSIDELIRSELKSSLLDEIVPVVGAVNGTIDQTEARRELIKKALVGLKTSGLRTAAKQAGIKAGRRSLEDLAEVVAKYYRWDEGEVARLILENDVDFRPDRGFVSRYFAIATMPDRSRLEQRLSYVRGRYIRTGVARWFVFEEIETRDDALVLTGSLRTYAASIDDRIVDSPRLFADPTEDRAEVRISSDEFITVSGASAGTARSAAHAFAAAADLILSAHISGAEVAGKAAKGELHDTARFMLDLLETRFLAQRIDEINPTVAKFKVGQQERFDPMTDDIERRPVLKAVSIEGAHLFDSVPACRLLVHEQRPLTDLTVQVIERGDDEVIVGRFPMRLSFEKDHVAVETGYGAGDHKLSSSVHLRACAAVELELTHGVSDPAALEVLKEKMRVLADSGKAPEEAAILRSSRRVK